VTIGRPDSIVGQFRETVRCCDGNTGVEFVVLSHHSLFYLYSPDGAAAYQYWHHQAITNK